MIGPVGTAQTRVYVDGRLESDGVPVAELGITLSRPGVVVWVDLEQPSREELHELAEELGLHELAVEDALEPHQRAKLDRYATHSFLSCHQVEISGEVPTMTSSEVDVFIGDHWLITVRQRPGLAIDELRRRWDRDPELSQFGVGFLLHGLLDLIVDGYFTAVEIFDDYYDDVMDGIFAERPMEPDAQRVWFEARRALLRFHRLVSPLREAVNSLMRSEQGIIADRMYPYYQDIYDHILRVGESTDSLRELASTVVEANLSLRDYRQNQIMKKVTSWAAIIAVPTLVTGFYGMNVPYPGNGAPTGAVWSIGLMVASSLALYGLFRVRDWL